jgi:hypothetical protein
MSTNPRCLGASATRRADVREMHPATLTCVSGWTWRSPRSRFFVACAIGGLVAAVVFAWMITLGTGHFFVRDPFGGFYDAQAHSLLHGHWDIPANAASFERFKLHGRYYMYFGPWPALLRMPIIAFTGDLDGRLTGVSMLVAFMVLLVFAARLAWRACVLVRGDRPPTRATFLAAGGFVFATGCGTPALFLAGGARVYNEAILWAVAWAVASLYFFIAYLIEPRTRHLAWACATATLALLSRGSVGGGLVVAFAVLLALQVIRRVTTHWRGHHLPVRERASGEALARWLGVSDAAANQAPWPVAVALAIPVVLYAYVNHSKFGTAFGIPYDKQDLILAAGPARRAVLANHGSLFGLRYAPTNLLQYLRPDAIGLERLFPWITFSAPAHIVGGVPYDSIGPTVSIPAACTLLVVLGIVGIVATIRAPRPAPGSARLEVLRVPILAGTLAIVGLTLAAALAQRYEGDVVPLLVVAGAAGLFWLQAVLERRRRWARNLSAGALVALAVWSSWTTFSLTLQSQRLFYYFEPTAARERFVGSQLDVNDGLGLGPPSDVQRGAMLPKTPGFGRRPTTAPPGRFFIVGDCAGLYVSDGTTWLPIEPTSASAVFPGGDTLLAGTQRWRVTFGSPTPGMRQPLWSTRGTPQNILWARWIDTHHIRIEYEWTGAPDSVMKGNDTLPVEAGQTYEFDVRIDPMQHVVDVASGGRLLLRGFESNLDHDRPSTLGQQDARTREPTTLDGTIHSVSTTPICDRLTNHQHQH